MLLWVMVIAGLALAAAALVLLIVSMHRAERRARRTLFQALGLDDQTVDLLMARSGDVRAELALVRRHPAIAETDAERLQADVLPRRLQPTIRFLHPVEGGAAAPAAGPAAADARSPAAGRRRLPHPGRHSRP